VPILCRYRDTEVERRGGGAVRELQTTIEIQAAPERVWQVLTDGAAYPEWNPFIRRLEGTLEPEARLEARIEPPDRRAMTFRPRVLAVEPNLELRWLGSFLFRGLFDGEHAFLIEPLGAARVRFVQRERFTGILVPFFGKGLAATQLGFERMNLALKARAEAGASS
jgi:hypothetical protein